MKISDEIRKRCDSADVDGDACGELRDLADRIDKETVELPKDKDGVPIHIGDTMYDILGEIEVTVESITLYKDGMSEVTTSCRGIKAKPDQVYLTHTIPDSFDRIADELDEMVDAADSADDSCEKLANLAERIRDLAKKEYQQ